MSRRTSSGGLRQAIRLCLAASLLFAASAKPAFAVFIDSSIPIPTELLSFGPIQGTAYLPLTNAATSSSEAGAPAATGDGYGWVNSNIAITLSSQRTPTPGPASTGQAFLGVPFAFPALTAAVDVNCIEGGTSGEVNNGDIVCVNSFFDVFFDVTITNIDSTTGFFGGLGPPQLGVLDLGPAFMRQDSPCIADTSQPNLGCLPPEGDAYIGHFPVVLPLGIDVNGNGNADVIKFEFVQHQVGDVTNTFIQGTNIVDTFNSTIEGSGSVGDAITDPPFTFTLTGPTTAQQGIVFAAVPEPATVMLLGLGAGLLGFSRRRKAG